MNSGLDKVTTKRYRFSSLHYPEPIYKHAFTAGTKPLIMTRYSIRLGALYHCGLPQRLMPTIATLGMRVADCRAYYKLLYRCLCCPACRIQLCQCLKSFLEIDRQSQKVWRSHSFRYLNNVIIHYNHMIGTHGTYVSVIKKPNLNENIRSVIVFSTKYICKHHQCRVVTLKFYLKTIITFCRW